MTRPYSIQFDRAKFKDAVLYICSTCEPELLGAVKLNKVLYLADMFRFAVEGTPLTGAPYRKRPFGPTTDALLPTIRELEEDGALKVAEQDYFGYKKKMYLSLRKPDIHRFNSDEIAWLNEVVDFVCRGNSAKTISEFTHNRAWEVVEAGEEIPYHNAFYFFPTFVSQETVEWGLKQAAQIETEKSKRSEMEHTNLVDFRKRMARAN